MNGFEIDTIGAIAGLGTAVGGVFWAGYHWRGAKASIELLRIEIGHVKADIGEVKTAVDETNGTVKEFPMRYMSKEECDRLHQRERE